MPGKGLPEGPYVTEQELRAMAEVASSEGEIEEEEKELIHSIFEFGDTIVREVMVPRPDIVAVEDTQSLRDVQALVLRHGYSRHPGLSRGPRRRGRRRVREGRPEGPAPGQDRRCRWPTSCAQAHFVPESKKVADLLREMQREKFHQALVTDEYGSVTGIVALEDLLEELVGEITDEYDVEEPEMVEVGDGVYRVAGKTSIDDLNETARHEPARRGVGHGGRARPRHLRARSPMRARRPISRACVSAPRRSRAVGWPRS